MPSGPRMRYASSSDAVHAEGKWLATSREMVAISSGVGWGMWTSFGWRRQQPRTNREPALPVSGLAGLRAALATQRGGEGSGVKARGLCPDPGRGWALTPGRVALRFAGARSLRGRYG